MIYAKIKRTQTAPNFIPLSRDSLGLCYLLYDYVASDLAKGLLVPAMEDWLPRRSGFFICYSSRCLVTGPLQAFIPLVKSVAARCKCLLRVDTVEKVRVSTRSNFLGILGAVLKCGRGGPHHPSLTQRTKPLIGNGFSGQNLGYRVSQCDRIARWNRDILGE